MNAKYVVMNEHGAAVGFYTGADHGDRLDEDGNPNPSTKIPLGAVEISDEVYAAWAGDTLGQRMVGGELVQYDRAAGIPTLAAIRRRRNALLLASDWTQLADVPMTTGARAAWASYRQALRDLPSGLTEPLVGPPVWPTPPA